MVLEAWLAGDVPTHFARRTLKAVSQNLEDLAKGNQQQDNPNSLAREMGRAGNTISRLETALRDSAQDAVREQLESLRDLARSTGPSHTP
jgi:ABC-type transporter Mla subunit MlaD